MSQRENIRGAKPQDTNLDHVTCVMGWYCGRGLASGKTKYKGFQPKIKSAIQNYRDGFMPCGHFACPSSWAHERADNVPDSEDIQYSCLERHLGCEQRGPYNAAQMRRWDKEFNPNYNPDDDEVSVW